MCDKVVKSDSSLIEKISVMKYSVWTLGRF